MQQQIGVTRRLKNCKVLRLPFALLLCHNLTVTSVPHFYRFVTWSLVLIIITGNSMDTNNYLNTDDYKFRIALHTGVMFLYLLEMHVLVLFLTDFPNPELYSSVLCFQFLILESTKQVVIATAIGIFIHFNNIYKLVHLQ